MKRWIAITLGIVSSIGGFFDMGEIVMTAEAGARFRYSLIWVVLVGVLGIILYAEMAGRIATVSQRPVFDVVRERLGVNVGFANLVGTLVVNLTTLIAEVAGIALAFELVTSVNYLLWAPLAAFLVWIIIWRVRFAHFERITGIVGMTMLVFGFAFWKLGPGFGEVLHGVFQPNRPPSERLSTYLYFVIAIFGASMTPYEVIFYSSGAVEEQWKRRDLVVNRATAYLGFTVGGILACSAIGLAAVVFSPLGMSVGSLAEVAMGPAAAFGKLGLVAFLVGLFASTIGAAVEVTLSNGYSMAQFFGWRWGKILKPADAPRFQLVILASLVIALLVTLTTVDPIRVTELSVVASAIALPLTYFPVLVVANDADYMGNQVNPKALNTVGSVYLALILLASTAAIPLMVITRMGA